MAKQIYVSLEMTDKYVKMLVSEYCNNRFNVLKVVKAACNGIKDYKIINPEAIKNCINACINDIKDKLGAKLEKVILIIPPVNFKRIPLKVNVTPSDKGITKIEIAKSYEMTRQVVVDPDVVCVNRMITKYTTNGISSRKFPDNTLVDDCLLSVDLLCADKDLVYSYCCLVEECGIEIADICLSNLSISKEAALFERSYNNNIILIDMNYSSCFISVLSKGRIAAVKKIDIGFEDYFISLKNKYPINENTLFRILKYNTKINDDSDDVLFAFSLKDGSYKNIISKEFNEIVIPILDEHSSKIIEETKSVLDMGPSCFELVGDCSDMISLAQSLDMKSNIEVKVYHPETFGIRESSMTSLIGSLFIKKEKAELLDENVECIDIFEFERIIDNSKINDEGETLTTKIKSLFEQYKKEKDNGKSRI